MTENVIKVMILKTDNLGESTARSYRRYAEDISFSGTSSEEDAINAFKNGEADIIVSGLLGINWLRVAEEVGNSNVIVFSALEDSPTIARVKEKGLQFVAVGLSSDTLIEAIRAHFAQK